MIINRSLILSPWNWVTIGIMALFGLLLLAVLFPEPNT